MSDQIIGRIDEMGSRIDELESSIGELMAQVRSRVSPCLVRTQRVRHPEPLRPPPRTTRRPCAGGSGGGGVCRAGGRRACCREFAQVSAPGSAQREALLSAAGTTRVYPMCETSVAPVARAAPQVSIATHMPRPWAVMQLPGADTRHAAAHVYMTRHSRSPRY
jgi:hypothetical protein